MSPPYPVIFVGCYEYFCFLKNSFVIRRENVRSVEVADICVTRFFSFVYGKLIVERLPKVEIQVG